MEIRQIKNIQDPDYVLLARDSGSVFNSPEWLSLFGDGLLLFGIYDAENKLTGSFFLYHEKKFLFSFYKNPPFTQHNACFFLNASKNQAKIISNEKRVVDAIAAFMDKLPAGVISCSFPFGIKDMQPFFWKNFKVIPHYTYRMCFEKSEKTLEEKMSAEHRNLLKKALNDGIRVEQITDYAIVKTLVLKTFERKKKKIDSAMIDKILFQFSNDKNSFAFASMKNDSPVAVTFNIFDRFNCYNLLSGYDPELKHGGAGILCLNKSMNYARESGIPCFDFEGSMLPQVEMFFRGFGADLVPYYSVNKAFLPLEFILKFIKRNQF